PASRNYHKWLTPEQYAARFGLSSNDVGTISAWLRSQGFEIVQIARGRNWIAFSGTAALVENAFHTQLHYYDVDGERHFANATEISIPQALDGVVAGFLGLNDFRLKPMGIREPVAPDFLSIIARPLYTDPNNSAHHFLAPDDIATIYNLAPLYGTGIDGSGVKMVIVGQSDINTADLTAFRSGFNLPGITQSNFEQILVPNSPDPGKTSDQTEADLDLEWSQAVARNAKIIYVNAATTGGFNGVFSSAQYAIDQNLAPVLSMSFGACEALNKSALPSLETLLQQANSQGITFLASSGDTGAAACDGAVTSATGGLAVNYPASSPEVSGVGGNEFSGDVNNPAQYWNSANNSSGESAISFIPEMAWNDTVSRGTLAASGGGASSCMNGTCSSGFPKPSWQTGTGVPKDNVRDVPDVAMAASPDHDGFILCSTNSCMNGIEAAVQANSIVGGTSASAPLFAGIVVLLNQFTGQAQGNINNTLYPLAQSTSNGIFHDVTSGDNIVPCKQGTPSCPASAPFQFGYKTGTGYDQVTGLGSVDATNLVCQWPGKNCTNVTLAVVPAQVNPGTSTPVTLTATVAGTVASGTPTGTVTFFNGSTAVSGSPVTLTGGTATLSYNVASLAAGVYPVSAKYSGDSSFAAASSAVVNLTVGNTSSTSLTFSPASLTAGSSGPVMFNATVAATSGTGTPTGTVTFSDASGPLGSAVPLSNGSATLSYNPHSLAGGTYSMVASYSGDSSFVPSSSSPQPLNIVDFAIAANPATVTIGAPGQGGATAIAITALGGFSQSLNFSCSGLPSEAACTFSSPSATSETLTITTAAAAAELQSHRNQFLFAFLLPGLFGLVFLSPDRRVRNIRVVRALGLTALLGVSILWMVGCGGGGSSTTGNSGTPAGTSTVTVTATTGGASAITHQITLTLTVQ
ncbi:MAG: Ig-like domain repeat protein, partial [Acidobacteriaceae bacterium]|nr:Ig-like domain repeat protein [Acidobacteriaceae bacterium]